MRTHGWQVVQDVIRLFIIGTGFMLAMVAVRFAWQAHKRHENFRVLGILSFGFLVLTPALTGITRFRDPLMWEATITYLIGLILGLLALRSNYVVAPTWWRLGGGPPPRDVDGDDDAER